MADEKGKGDSYLHLSSDLTSAGPLVPPSEEAAPDPPFEELGAIPIAEVHDQPTQIIRAHKALDRARQKRRERLEEGRTYVVDRDKPPPPPPGKPLVWWLLAALSVIGLVSVSVLVVLRLTQEDMMDEAIAEESEPLPVEPQPPPPIRRAPVETASVARVEPPPPPPPPAQQAKAVAGPRNKRSRNRTQPQPKVVEAPVEIPATPAPPPVEEAPIAPSLPAKSLLSINGPSGAQVEIDARAMGVLPLEEIELAPGRHAVWVTLRGFQVWQRDVLVKKGETTSLEVKLTPIPPP